MRWREVTDQQWARFSAGEIDLRGPAPGPGAGVPGRRADRRRGRRLVRAVHRALRGRLGALPRRPARPGRCSPPATATRCSPTPASTSRTASCASSACATASRPSCAPPSWASPSPRPAPSSRPARPCGLPPHQVAYVGDHPEIDGRGAADAGLLSVWIDRYGGHGGRASSRRTAPDLHPRRTPRDPRRGYPFWSAVHLRVMFFLRRRRAGRKAGPGGAN